MSASWERRWHPLLEQWVIVSAHSALRPWSGATLSGDELKPPAHDPECYLCPGVTRAAGLTNPHYTGPFAFDNDFPSLAVDAPETTPSVEPLRIRERATGRCRVLCWSPRHDQTLATLPAEDMRAVVDLWQDEYRQLSHDPAVKQVLIFENKGREIGVSNLHPHGQVYATGFVTDTAQRFRQAQQRFRARYDTALLPSLLADQQTIDELVVEAGEHFVCLVPFAARFAFETWIIPRQQRRSIAEYDTAGLDELAGLYQRQAQRYDRLFHRSSPNITLLHNAPCDHHIDNDDWCFHVVMQPPLRDPYTLKYLAGFESGSNNIVNPVQPEVAAQALRAAGAES